MAWAGTMEPHCAGLPCCIEDNLVRAALRAAMPIVVVGVLGTYAVAVIAEQPGNPKAVTSEGGKHSDGDGNPTYKIDADGTVDYYAYAGFVRYSAECLRCHGPDALG